MREETKPTEAETWDADIAALRAKYPGGYIETWTPEDFEQVVTNNPHNVRDWDDPRYVATARKLIAHFDGDAGTDWDRVKYAKEVPRKRSRQSSPEEGQRRRGKGRILRCDARTLAAETAERAYDILCEDVDETDISHVAHKAVEKPKPKAETPSLEM